LNISSEPIHFIVATAGHVDHGKSSLVRALTGTDPDRLPEEKLRGVTIDLGFANLQLPPPVSGHRPLSLGVIDVPGHEDFVKNMVAGVGSIDLALLVIAADDGWMPQTEEHVQILAYLGVTRAVVALTKIDLTADAAGAAAEIRKHLANTPFADAAIVPTSIVSGRGLEELNLAVANALADAPIPGDIGKPRLPIDRAFRLQGIGSVVTGTLTGGVLQRGQTVVIQPGGKKGRIRSIQSHNQNVETTGPGTRTALNFPDLVPDVDLRRGDTVTLDSFGSPSTTVDVLLEVSPRANRLLKDGTHAWIHYGSASVAAHIFLANGKSLAPAGRAPGQLRFEEPSFLFVGDRFIVRDWAEQSTLAGGIVLDVDTKRKLLRSPARENFLAARAQVPSDAVRFVASQIERDGVVPPSRLLVKSRFSARVIAEAVSELAARRQIVLSGDWAFDSSRWQALERRATDSIDAYHREHPEQTGITLTALHAILEADLPGPDVFEAFVKTFCTGEFVRVGAAIRRAKHAPALAVNLRVAGDTVRAKLAERPFDPPSRKELAPDPASQQALRFLIQTGEAMEINTEVVIAMESWQRATEMIRHFLRERGPATVSELRQTLGSSRRVIVPLLEKLDREGVTLRQNDRRVLRR
jgi:selenocysteine-specific elongation factor